MGDVLADPARRAALRSQIVRFFAAFPAYRGLSLDFESLPDAATPPTSPSSTSSLVIFDRSGCAFM